MFSRDIAQVCIMTIFGGKNSFLPLDAITIIDNKM